LVALLALGCPRAEAPVSRGAPALLGAVGPIPGPAHETAPRTHELVRDPAGVAAGRSLFVAYNCSGCHGGHAGGGMGPSLRDEVWIYGGQDEDVFDSIAEGRANGMPAWGSLLSEQQLWMLTGYVKSLRTPREPDPPR
jgi:cytochrome c oxidase cbb3-type subunit 3